MGISPINQISECTFISVFNFSNVHTFYKIYFQLWMYCIWHSNVVFYKVEMFLTRIKPFLILGWDLWFL